MPRFIQQKCTTCQYTEEIEKPLTFFRETPEPPVWCPQCSDGMMQKTPALFQISTSFKPAPVSLQKLAPDGILPDDVRQAFAQELFDPCSCGQHAPADIDEHSQECRNKLYSFVQNPDSQ